MRFEIFTPQELVEKYGNGEPEHLCPLLGVLKPRFRRRKDVESIETIEMIQEMGHELRLWGQSQKSRAEKAEARVKELEDKEFDRTEQEGRDLDIQRLLI